MGQETGKGIGSWRRLDNTAKIFPVIANENSSQVFRVSATLTEEVRPELLQQALEEILPYMDHFRVRLRRGLFWYYFEENKRTPQVQRESTYPCRYLDPHASRKFPFRVTYFKERINLEVFHALTDGLGAVEFLRNLVSCYLGLAHGNADGQIWKDTKDSGEEISVEDSYLENYCESAVHSYSSRPAYRLEGNYLPFGTCQVLHGIIPVPELKAVCARYGVSITKYLAAVLIWSIWKEYLEGKPAARAVVLNMPINLRAIFGSHTMSNFFAVSLIGFLFRNPDTDFATLVDKISHQVDRKVKREVLQESISYNVSNEKKWYLRIAPLVLKRPVMELIFRIRDRAHTMTLSNVGVISMDEPERDEIRDFRIMIGVSRRQPLKCAVCSFGGKMVVTFTSVFSDSHLQRRFFEHLREEGVSVSLEGNEPSVARKRDGYPRVRRILVLQKGGEAKASRMAKKAGDTGVRTVRGIGGYLFGTRNLKEELRRRFHL